MIVDAAHQHGIRVSVCGEMAGDPALVPLLLGLGVDSLSMTPSWLPTVKYLVRAMKMTDAKSFAAETLAMTSAKEIYAKSAQFLRSRVSME